DARLPRSCGFRWRDPCPCVLPIPEVIAAPDFTPFPTRRRRAARPAGKIKSTAPCPSHTPRADGSGGWAGTPPRQPPASARETTIPEEADRLTCCFRREQQPAVRGI